MTSAAPEPGWYLDPDDSENERFWDGSAWTEVRRVRQEPAERRKQISPSDPYTESGAPITKTSSAHDPAVAKGAQHSYPTPAAQSGHPHRQIDDGVEGWAERRWLGREELVPGAGVRIAASGDDRDGQVGVIAEIVDDGAAGLDFMVRFANDPEPYAYARNELTPVAPPPPKASAPPTSAHSTQRKRNVVSRTVSAAPTRSRSTEKSLGAKSTQVIVGTAALVVAVILAGAAFMNWADMSAAVVYDNSYLTASAGLTGTGSVSVDVPAVPDAAVRDAFQSTLSADLRAGDPSSPGFVTLISAALIAVLALNYRRSPWSRTALGIMLLSAPTFAYTLWRLFDASGMLNASPTWNSPVYSPGLGAVIAALAALVLCGLGITAFVIQRR